MTCRRSDPTRRVLWRGLRPLIAEHPFRTALLVGLLALAGVAEGVGLAALLPALQALVGDGADSGPGRAILNGLRALGLPPTLGVLLAAIAVALATKALLRWVAMAHVGAVVAETAERFRLRLVRGLLGARWGYLEERPSGHLASALIREAQWAAYAYRDACAALAGAIQLGVYASLVVVVSWKLGLATLVATLALGVALAGWVGASHRAGAAQVRRGRRLLARTLDVLNALKPIKAMGREAAFLPTIEREAAALRRAERAQVRAAEGLRSFQEPLVAALIATGIYAAVEWGGLHLPELLLLALLLQRMASRFQAVQSEYQAAGASASALRSLSREIGDADAAAERAAGTVAAARRSTHDRAA